MSIGIITTNSMTGIVPIYGILKSSPNKIGFLIISANIPEGYLNLQKVINIPKKILFYKFIETVVFSKIFWLFQGVSFEKFLKIKKIPNIKTKNPNDLKWNKIIKKHKLKYLLNFGPSILAKKITENKKLKVINFHSGKLPENKGICNHFWSLIKNRKNTYATAHFMSSKIDSGKIIATKRVKIQKYDSVHSLNFKTLKAIAALVDIILSKIANQNITSYPQGKSGTYRSFPSESDLNKIKQNRKKLISILDFVESLKIVY